MDYHLGYNIREDGAFEFVLDITFDVATVAFIESNDDIVDNH